MSSNAYALQRVVIAGGGTGGHLIPGLAVARELAARGCGQIVFVGTERGIEARMVPAAGFPLRLVTVGGLKNLTWRRRLRTMLDLPRAVGQSLRILRETQAQVVLGIGGYASGPALLAAALLRIPVVVLEVNAKTGLANRLAAPWVRRAAVSFPETAKDFRCATVTGVPVREAFFQVPPARHGRPLHLLVFGGSQGARAINRAAVAAAAQWQRQGLAVSVLHQTGSADYNEVRGGYAAAGVAAGDAETARILPADEWAEGVQVQTAAFIDDMPGAMAWADMVVCRSGASTLAELAAAARASILVPFPGAADNHQWKNADAYRRAGAARLLEQRELTGETLAAAVAELTAAPERLRQMESAVRGFAHPGAAEVIAGLLAQAAGGSGVLTEKDVTR